MSRTIITGIGQDIRPDAGVPIVLLLLFLLLPLVGRAQEETTRRPDRQVPTKPFRIIGNIYYVGQTDNSLPGSDDAAYLITTPEGHILLDTGFETTVPQIRENIRVVGFRLEEIKYLIHSHSHSDHVAGDALMKEAIPGIQLLAMEGDAAVIASGGEADFDEDRPRFKSAPVDEMIKDGHQLQLGGVRLQAHRTAGHTEGCTTWTTEAEESGRRYQVIFVCSARISQGVKLVNNERYPEIAEDYASTYRLLKSMSPDVFLASHGFFFGMVEKAKRLEGGETPNPFIDPAGFKAYIEQSERDFLAELRKQGGTPP
jgi:metallo-beta-lactamase class B